MTDPIERCPTCGVQDPLLNEYCSDGFHAPGETYWPTDPIGTAQGDLTQFGDDVAAEMRAYFQSHKQYWVPGTADNLMLGLFNIAANALRSRPIGTAQERELIERPFGAGFLKLACPGDQQDEPTWILRFSDPDIREAVFIGEDAEREAWAAWNRYAPSYNCYLFQIASIEAADALASRIAEVERLRERVSELEETSVERVMKALWPLLGGNHTEAELWHEIGDAVSAALSQQPKP